ncbi:hypothetical protein O181_029079 [Austropuccinia psidii MF-1]|uniref:GPI ethanolamine phosphate transferase 1 n=1 Tax=Austropuccinia psidii MF-1 TaxID=1389203 RepID=A0A9Q3CRS2_9BASI|nr:hypothetical protein [Austropuccinia psidii MF-1]
MSFGPATGLLILGIFFHASYLVSIFDVYFVSPVVKVNQRFSSLDRIVGEPTNSRIQARPLASRVVLIVGDGLRADKLFSFFPDPPFNPPLPVPQLPALQPVPNSPHQKIPSKMTPAPYLRALIENGQASWGVSHTRVPTESRPGHVAIIAGMYEDVSAVTRGWKMNPVNFDSVFNQSSHSFTFGSPDILPMFKYGASDPSRVDAWSYHEEAEDFTKDAAQLDVWVLDRLKLLLSEAKKAGPGSSLDRQLRSDKVFFFLHLLGLDTTGHSYRPHSPEYLRNIQVVDQVVRGAEKALNDFFDDDRTAFIFTADHGMSNIGNHGDGDPDNTRTPIVAWGSGIQMASHNVNSFWNDSTPLEPYYQNWHLNMTQRKDIDQADIAALMAALTGICVPSNSVGRLPLSYLNASSAELARATYANTRQILQQYEAKHGLKAAAKFAFRPFPELPLQESLLKPTISERLFYIHRLILTGRDTEAIKACVELQSLALEGLKYLQRYDWLLLRTMVVAGYIGWMVYSAIFLLRTYVIPPAPRDHMRFGMVFGCIAFSIVTAWFYLEQAPGTYFLYAFFPCYFWSQIIDDLDSLLDMVEWLANHTSPQTPSWTMGLITLISLEAMVLGYFYRIVWTLGWVLIGILWPRISMSAEFRRVNRPLLNVWACSSVFSSTFTLLSVEKGESLLLITLGGLAFLIAGYTSRSMKFGQPTRSQLAVILITLLITISSMIKLRQKQGLPVFNQAVGWILFVGSSIVPLFFTSSRTSSPEPTIFTPTARLIEIVFAYAPVFIVLSISYELLFYLAFSISLLVWLELESRLVVFNDAKDRHAGHGASSKQEVIKPTSRFLLPHTRLSLFFLFFIHVGFFGTGNVGSLSSFYLEPVYRLVPIFNPFLMSILLIIKILVPFLIVSSVFTVLTSQLGLPKFSLFISSLVISDILTLNFFFLVNDSGSWLEIGQSIMKQTPKDKKRCETGPGCIPTIVLGQDLPEAAPLLVSFDSEVFRQSSWTLTHLKFEYSSRFQRQSTLSFVLKPLTEVYASTTSYSTLVMLVIGLTGGIASGKSTVSGLIKSYDIPVIDLDELAREVVEPGSSALISIQRHFPNEVDLINPNNGTLNRERLGQIIFHDSIQRKWLDNLLHPRIRRLLLVRLIKIWLMGAKACVIDSPLLIETGMWKFCGKVVVVYCSEELQLQRLQHRNHLARSAAKARIESQLPLKSKLHFADYILDNSGQLQDLVRQVESLVRKIDKSTNRLIWLINWLLPPAGILNGLITIVWRVWMKPISTPLKRKRSPSYVSNPAHARQ